MLRQEGAQQEAEQGLPKRDPLFPSRAGATPQALATGLLVSPVSRAAIHKDGPCEPPEEEVGVLWDAACLTSLLTQHWLFLGSHHLYVVADLEAVKASASRYQEARDKDGRLQGLH